MFGPVDMALAATITQATAPRAEPVITRVEFAPGHEDERLSDEAVAAKLRQLKAAPKLLLALKALLFNVEHGNGLAAWGDSVRKARAAIAEAEGRSPQEPA